MADQQTINGSSTTDGLFANGSYGNQNASNASHTDLSLQGFQQDLKLASDVVMSILVIIIIFSVGCTLEIKPMWKQLTKPIGIVAGIALQFGLIPVAAFGLAHALGPTGPQAVAMLIVASCPAGSLSPMFAMWAEGDVVLSVCITIACTIAAMGFMPLLMFIYSPSWTDQQAVIPYARLGISLISIIVPLSLGMLVKWRRPDLALKFKKLGGLAGLLCIICSIVFSALLYPSLFDESWNLWLGAILLPAITLLLGFGVSSLLCLSYPERRAMAFAGCPNLPLAATLIFLSFTPDWMRHMLGFVIIFGISVILEMVFVTAAYKLYKRFSQSRHSKRYDVTLPAAANGEDERQERTGMLRGNVNGSQEGSGKHVGQNSGEEMSGSRVSEKVTVL